MNTKKITIEDLERLKEVFGINPPPKPKLSPADLMNIAAQVPFSYSDVKRLHDILPHHMRIKETILSACNILTAHGFSVDMFIEWAQGKAVTQPKMQYGMNFLQEVFLNLI